MAVNLEQELKKYMEYYNKQKAANERLTAEGLKYRKALSEIGCALSGLTVEYDRAIGIVKTALAKDEQ